MHRDSQHDAGRRHEGERGQTMAEYAVVLSVITIIVMAAIILLGDSAGGIINEVAERIS